MEDSTHTTARTKRKELGGGSTVRLVCDPLYVSNSDHPGAQLVADLFDGTNFLSWSQGITMPLNAKGKLGFIDGTFVRPSRDESPEDHDLWGKCDSMVKCWLVNSMVAKVGKGFMTLTRSRDVWEELKSRYEEYDGPHLYQLKRNLMDLRQNDLSVVDYYCQLKMLWDEIENIEGFPNCTCGVLEGCKCKLFEQLKERENRNQVIQFLAGLNSNFDLVKQQIMATDPLPLVSKVYHRILTVDRQRLLDVSGKPEVSALVANSTPEAFAANKQQGYHGVKKDFKRAKNDRKCEHCGKRGHLIEQCFEIYGEPDWYKEKYNKGDRNTGYKGKGKKANAVDIQDSPLDQGVKFPGVSGLQPEVFNAICSQVVKALRGDTQDIGGFGSGHSSVNFAGPFD